MVNELLQTLCNSCLLVVQDVALLLTYCVDMYVHGVCQWNSKVVCVNTGSLACFHGTVKRENDFSLRLCHLTNTNESSDSDMNQHCAEISHPA